MENAKQVEKNISASFGYVKKDMLMLNDAFSDLHDKVQQLSQSNAMLLEEIEKLKAKNKSKNILPTKKKFGKKVIKKKPIKKVVKKKK